MSLRLARLPRTARGLLPHAEVTKIIFFNGSKTWVPHGTTFLQSGFTGLVWRDRPAGSRLRSTRLRAVLFAHPVVIVTAPSTRSFLRCVVSATSCVYYLQTLAPAIPLIPVCIAILALFALLVAWGVKDSANVAMAIFACHVGTLMILVVSSLVHVIRDSGSILTHQWSFSWPDVTSDSGVVYHGNVFYAIFFGACWNTVGYLSL